MAHLAAGHHVPVQVKDILKWRARVGREPETFDASVGGDPRSGKHEPAGQLGVGEVGHRPNVRARYDEHV